MSEAPIQVTSDGRVTKVITKPGYGAHPRRNQLVTVHYTGTLLSGQVFDSSVGRKPFMFTIGKGVISGWNHALMSMKLGEKATFTIAPEYAYGVQGCPPAIPPNSTLNFEIELLKIHK